jgi:beta-N-acetylhexosaminidase
MNAPETLNGIRALNSALQQSEYQSSLEATVINPENREVKAADFIPLFIGIVQEGGGAPYDEIYSGLTEIPSAMAIGATWDSELAHNAGEVLGAELRALGFNLLLGPSLDILEDPRIVGEGDLGVRTFGGDPFWVSVMGKAYVSGLHEGSNGALAVVAKHFPGLGGSDRNTMIEVATIRRSLEQLAQFELVPFDAVTSDVPGNGLDVVDGLLTSHIRYQGLQGNIRSATRPVSLDPQALLSLLGMEGFSEWHEGGGVVVSDSLGARSIRRFYDPSETVFNGHLVARDALIAGNDLLQLTGFETEGDPSGIESINRTLDFFEQKYLDDQVFAERVNEAVLRILALKLRIYGGDFEPSKIRPGEGLDINVGEGGEVTLQIARQCATLVNPSPEELLDEIGEPPSAGERIAFFTDVREIRQCSECQPIEQMGANDLAEKILNLYGPRGTRQVAERDLIAFTMAELALFLGEEPPSELVGLLTPSILLESWLESADWIVFSVLKSSDDVFGSNGLKLLLDRRPDLIRDKTVIVFAYDVPYDSDATDISKVDAYYALYSSYGAFVEVAARMLFQELPVTGASPVNIPAVGYDLLEVLAPDPNQVIALDVSSSDVDATIEVASSGFRSGELIYINTGIIVDINGNPVPDGTPVTFTLYYQAAEMAPVEVETTTKDGSANMSLTLDRLGMLSIEASSELARTSEILQLDVQEDVLAFVTVIAPTAVVRETDTPEVTQEAVEGEIDAISGDYAPEQEIGLGFLDLILGLVGMIMVAGIGYGLWTRWGLGNKSAPYRYALVGVVFSLASYDYIAMGLAGASELRQTVGWPTSLIVTLGCGLMGMGMWALVAMIWRKIRER